MTEIIWKEPPPGKKGRPRGRGGYGKAHAFVQELKANPGRWAYYGAMGSARTGTQLTDIYGVEATVRTRPDKKFDVYARWPEDGKPWNSATEEP